MVHVYLFKSQPYVFMHHLALQLALVAQLDARPTGDQEVTGFIPAGCSNSLWWRLIMKYFVLPVLSLLLIQEGQLSVSGKRMYTYWLTV